MPVRISRTSEIARTPPKRYQMLFVSTGIRYSLMRDRIPSCSSTRPSSPTWDGASGDGGGLSTKSAPMFASFQRFHDGILKYKNNNQWFTPPSSHAREQTKRG